MPVPQIQQVEFVDNSYHAKVNDNHGAAYFVF